MRLRGAWWGVSLCSLASAAALAADGEPAAEECTYLRVSLSAPQRVAKPPEDEALQRHYLAIFDRHLREAGFRVTEPTQTAFAWEVFSQVERVDGGQLSWSYAFLPMPGVLDGVIEFPTFSVIDRDRGERVQFTTYHGLDHFRATEFPLKAAVASEMLANLYLPVARRLCAERDLSLDAEQARLERIRAELAAEIERVGRRRIEQRKHLEIEVDRSD